MIDGYWYCDTCHFSTPIEWAADKHEDNYSGHFVFWKGNAA